MRKRVFPIKDVSLSDRNRRYGALWFVCSIGVITAIVVPIVLTQLLHKSEITPILPNTNVTNNTTNTTTTTTTLPPVTLPPTCTDTCGIPYYVHTPPWVGEANAGMVVAYNRADENLYAFNGKNSKSITRSNVTFTTPPYAPVLNFGPNLIPNGNLPSEIFSIVAGAIFIESKDVWLVSDDNGRCFYISSNFTTITLLPEDGNTRRGFVNVNGTIYSVGRFAGITELQPDTCIGVSPWAPATEIGTGNSIWNFYGMDQDPTTGIIWVAYQRAGFPSQQGRWLGILDLEAMTILPINCTDTLGAVFESTVGGIAIDKNGRFWFAVGGGGANPTPHSVYTLPASSAPELGTATISQNYNILCDAVYYGNLEETLVTLQKPTVNGTTCMNSTAYFTAYLNTATSTPAKKKKKKRMDPAISIVGFSVEEEMVGGNSTAIAVGNTPIMDANFTVELNSNGTQSKRYQWVWSALNYKDEYSGYVNVQGTARRELNDTDSNSIDSDGTDTAYIFRSLADDILRITVIGVGSAQLSTIGGVSATCMSPSNDYVIRYDNEASRWVVVWSSKEPRDKLCVLVSDTGNALGTWSFYEFDFTGQILWKLDFSIWGDYYTACWNDLALSVPNSDAHCFVIERDRIINGGGAPRWIAVPRPSVTATERGTATPHHQPPNNGPRGPVMLAFPCGIFTVMSSAFGGVVNMRLCQNVDFDTMMITTTDSVTTVGTYDSGVGSCPSETECIVMTDITFGPATVSDPLRYDVSTYYRHFPASGYEKMVVGITANANGVDLPIVYWGEFIMKPTGQLELTAPMSTYLHYQDGSTITANRRFAFAPSFTYDPKETLYMAFISTFTHNLYDISLLITRRATSVKFNNVLYRYPTTPRGQWYNKNGANRYIQVGVAPAIVFQQSPIPVHGLTKKMTIQSIKGSPRGFIVSSFVPYYIPNNINGFTPDDYLYSFWSAKQTLNNVTLDITWSAIDLCCEKATCSTTHILGTNNFTLPV